LWDLAGQPDYRLIHALFIDDADLALVIFDPTHHSDPLSGVEYWLKQLKVGQSRRSPEPSNFKLVKEKPCPTLLVAARTDRGAPQLTHSDLEAYCKQKGIKGYLATSAKLDEGINELITYMRSLIPWDEKPATVTTETFKRIKDFVLGLKEIHQIGKIFLTLPQLRKRLEVLDPNWNFTDDEMRTAVGHLANHGYLTYLSTSKRESRILLVPELLNNLAASFVLEARRHLNGLGSLEERKLSTGGYKFSELSSLDEIEQAVLIDAATELFLEHHICFREIDLLGNGYLVFPDLINMKRPTVENTTALEDGTSYTVEGAVENVYASLVVLMGYTQTFTRTNQWRDHARYEVGTGEVCGFRLEDERAGALDFVLSFSPTTPAPIRMLFQGMFEHFLSRRDVSVRRFEPAICINGHALNRAVIREHLRNNAESAFCNQCGERIRLQNADQPVRLTIQQTHDVAAKSRTAIQRSHFEKCLFRLKSFVADHKIEPIECFVSYAWGVKEHEQWVETLLAKDLQKAGFIVLLDRWENTQIGANLVRFMEKASTSHRVIVVGTRLYRTKYDNQEPLRGFAVAAEGDLIGKRMTGTESQKQSVLPVLLEGTDESSFPIYLHGRIHADFREEGVYCSSALSLLLSLYNIKPQDAIAIELRELLEG
jgi:hypothetical protein